MKSIRNIWLYDSLVTSSVPGTIGHLSILKSLKLSNNSMSGRLPSEMGLLQNMDEFLFAWNDMGGTTIPKEMWNTKSLIFLDSNGAEKFGVALDSAKQFLRVLSLLRYVPCVVHNRMIYGF